jgi:hypothetical protein
MSIKDLWSHVRGYAHLVRSTINRLVFKGWSRDREYYSVSLFRFEVRRWKQTKRWDIILWWPKLRVIKGKVERP